MTEANSNIGPAHQNLQENNNEIISLIESVKKLSILINYRDTEVVCDLGSECSIITYEEASAKTHITDKVISGIVKQISHRRISISLYQLMEIAKRKKRFLNDTTSLSSSSPSSGSDSKFFYDYEDFTVDIVK
ncbi:7446_t:CDS:2, partial [Dentiscutata heterogama]